MNAVYTIEQNHEGYFVRERLWRYRSKYGYATFGASNYYATQAEAEALAAWLTERLAGYPVNLALTGAP